MTTGKLERPRLLGRLVRILAGSALLIVFVNTLIGYTDLVGPTTPSQPLRWLGVALCFYFLADVVNLGFGRTWARWPQLVTVLFAVAAAVFDLAHYGTAWGRPLGFVVLLLLTYVTGHLGLSFIIAGIAATPG